MVQMLRICLALQGTLVGSLVREDPTCHRAAIPKWHNYRARDPEPTSYNYCAYMLQLLKLLHLQSVLWNKRSHRKEEPAHCN